MNKNLKLFIQEISKVKEANAFIEKEDLSNVKNVYLIICSQEQDKTFIYFNSNHNDYSLPYKEAKECKYIDIVFDLIKENCPPKDNLKDQENAVNVNYLGITKNISEEHEVNIVYTAFIDTNKITLSDILIPVQLSDISYKIYTKDTYGILSLVASPIISKEE